jgi:hypothetical protein
MSYLVKDLFVKPAHKPDEKEPGHDAHGEPEEENERDCDETYRRFFFGVEFGSVAEAHIFSKRSL